MLTVIAYTTRIIYDFFYHSVINSVLQFCSFAGCLPLDQKICHIDNQIIAFFYLMKLKITIITIASLNGPFTVFDFYLQ